MSDEARGPVALAATDDYATMLTVQDLRKVVKDLDELRGRGLLPAAYDVAATEIQVRCRQLSQRLNEEIKK